jgi:hypothetical protein
MNHLAESLQFDILQSRLHSPSDETALLGEIVLGDTITSNSTVTPTTSSSANQRNRRKSGPAKMASISNDDTDRIRWSCDAIHGFIKDRSCKYIITVNYLDILYINRMII